MGRLKPNDSNIHEEVQDELVAPTQDYNYEKPPAQPFPPTPPEPVVQLPHHYQHPSNNVINNNNNNVGFGLQQQQQQPIGFGQPVVGVGMPASSQFVNNNNNNNNNNVVVQNQPWKTDLFGCMDDPQNAIITLLFPCVTFGQVAEILDTGSPSCGTSGKLYGTILFCIWMPCILSCTYRTKMRSRFGLVESPAPDWLVHFLCEHLALCQIHRELRQRGLDPSIGWAGNVAKQQQRQMQQFCMTPPMQQRM